MYRFLTDDSSSADTLDQAVIDKRVDNLLSLDDMDITWDLRRLNGNPESTKFDRFWAEMESYFNENDLAVQERRHGDHMYLPYAISIEDLVSTIKSRVEPETPIPFSEYVRLQFWPSNPTSKTALRHTGRFHVKFSLQTRQIRAKDEDSHFAAAQLLYLKNFAVKYREFLDLFWLDDKSVVPIGEPGSPVGTGVHPHNPSLVPAGKSLSSLDHDYSVCVVIPSVAFHTDIPEDVSETFFSGQAFVTVKDKIFSPSNVIRHACELTNIIKSHYSDEDHMNTEKPVLILYTDGGPDHRTTFGSVQVASIAMFMWLDLDMFITARTAPMESWANLAERVNSVLNLALQNVALDRAKMSEELEMRMKRVFTLKSARDTALRCPAFKEGLVASVKPILHLLENRFSHLKIKGESVAVNSPADSEALRDFFSIVKDIIDINLDANKLTKKDLEKSEKLTDFMNRHCRFRQYILHIKKCVGDDVSSCWYCVINPPRLPNEVYDNLYYVPDPVISRNDKEKYKNFSEVYGHITDDSLHQQTRHKISATGNC